MRNTFWPNRIFERQSSQNSYTGLKFSPKRENGALFMKIVQNALFRSCAARFGQIKFVSVKLLKIVTLVPNSLQNGKTVRYSWKLYKTLFSGHAEHVLAKSHLWGWKLSESSHWPQILSKTGKQCAFHENCRSCAARFGKIAFLSTKVVNSSHWPEILFKTAKQCAFHENCTKRSFQVMRSTVLAKSHLWASKLSKPSHWPQILSKEGKQCAFHENCTKPFFQVMRSTVLAKSHFWASKLSKSSHWPEILFKTGKQCAFHENCTKRSFQVKRSTFWPNRICERQSCQNRHTGLKFSQKRENSALFMKIVQNPLLQVMRSTFWANCIFERQSSQNRETRLKVSSKWKNSALSMKIVQNARFRSNAARFGEIALLSVKSCQNRHTGLKLSSKRENSALNIVQNALLRSCAARFGQIAFLSVKVFKIVTLAWNSLQNGKTVRFPWKLYKTLFSSHAQHVLAKSHLERQSCQTGKQCAFHENCTKRLVSGHAQEVLPKSYFWGSNFSKSLHLSQILFKTEPQCALHESCRKHSFQVMLSTFWPNRIFERQSSQNRHTGLKFSSKRENSALSMKIVQNALFRSRAARFGQIKFVSVKVLKIVTLASNSLQKGKTVRFPWKLYKTLFSGEAQHVLAKSNLLASKFSKSSHWSQILSKKGKRCAFHENCTKRSFEVMRSTFWPNRIFERQSS